MRKVNDLSAVDKEGEKKEEIDRKSKKKKKKLQFYIFWSQRKTGRQNAVRLQVFSLSLLLQVLFFFNDFLCFK